MGRPGIMLYFDILEPIRMLSDEDKGRLLVAMLEYGRDGTMPKLEGPLGIAWSFVYPLIDKDIFAYAIDTVNIPYNFPGVNLLALEANFEQERLDLCQKMPEKVRHRISNTHMEINMLCRCLQHMDLSKCRELYLLHLSDATSHEGHFINKVARVVPRHVKVTACPR